MMIFLAAVFWTFFMNAVHWYTQVQTYPLFAWVTKGEFVPFHKEYERRLPVALYAPYTLQMVATVLLFFFRPESVGLGWVVVLFVLGAFIMAESLAFALPIHSQLDREGKNDRAVRRLIFFNAFRLAAGTASSAIVLYLLARVISA